MHIGEGEPRGGGGDRDESPKKGACPKGGAPPIIIKGMGWGEIMLMWG